MDYLNKPPQRYDHVFQKNSGSREMVEDPQGEYVRFDDMDLYMFEGSQLMQRLLTANQELQRAALEVLGTYMPQFPDSRAVDDCLVALAAAVTATNKPEPYWVRTFWSPDKKHLVTVHVTGGEAVNIIAFQDDNGDEWEPVGTQENMAAQSTSTVKHGE